MMLLPLNKTSLSIREVQSIRVTNNDIPRKKKIESLMMETKLKRVKP